MTPNFTREELRADILQITTTVVTENNRRLIKMINEDLHATNRRIDSLDQRMKKGFKAIDLRFDRLEHRMDWVETRLNEVDGKLQTAIEKIDFTHKLLHVHIANPSAHHRPS
jgi:hypothetical protein